MFVTNEQKAFNDDIPQLLKKAPAAPIDDKKWLFVIGAEKYKHTDDILYSRRSSELFAQVVAKTIGVGKGRQKILLDNDGATSGSIEDTFKILLKDVRAGDTIYFYYSGHGIPVPDQNNEAYMLPVDKIPDFVADNDFYKINNIYQKLYNSNASKVFVFMDSCFTGQTDGKSVLKGKAATRLEPKKWNLSTTGKMAVITAGNSKQYSNALPERGQRLFSYYLMRALLSGDYNNISDLATKVSADVTAQSLRMDIKKQTPVLDGNKSLDIF